MVAIVVHGGAGGTSSPQERGCNRAAQVGMEILRQKGSALDAAVATVEWMENTGIFDAGTGSVLRFDGVTIQMDASVATSGGLLGAVGAVENVNNPVLLARAVAEETPHKLIVGPGATKFAREKGLREHPGPSELAKRRHQRLLRSIQRGRFVGAPGWTPEALAKLLKEQLWENGDGVSVGPKSDTVGAIALDALGSFAVAASTGGMSVMLLGRVGDVPIQGAGFQIGPLGGVLASGIGEEIIRLRGADQVYQRIQLGTNPQQACAQTTQLFDPLIPVGFIALTKEGFGIASNDAMPSCSIVE